MILFFCLDILTRLMEKIEFALCVMLLSQIQNFLASLIVIFYIWALLGTCRSGSVALTRKGWPWNVCEEKQCTRNRKVDTFLTLTSPLINHLQIILHFVQPLWPVGLCTWGVEYHAVLLLFSQICPFFCTNLPRFVPASRPLTFSVMLYQLEK